MEQTPSLEYCFATLIASYLTHVQQSGGLPSTVGIGIGLEMAARQRPCVICHIDTLEFEHPKIIKASGLVMLHTHADETPVLSEAVWISVLRDALSHTQAIFDYIASLPETEKKWDLRRLHLTRCESEISREERTRTHTIRLVAGLRAL